MEHKGNPCLGFAIGLAIAIPFDGMLAWLLQIIVQKHLTYWQALIIVIFTATLVGLASVLVGLRHARNR